MSTSFNIGNQSDIDCDYYVYNNNDRLRAIALTSGHIDQGSGGTVPITVPDNGDGPDGNCLYWVRFEKKWATPGSSAYEIAGSTVWGGNTVTLIGKNGDYDALDT